MSSQTASPVITIEQLWKEAGFQPNEHQKAAILHTTEPLYLPAGPGSGKTRVLLWRTLNLCVFHNVSVDEIYLGTFTEKAARQLREGLRALFGLVTNYTGVQYDISSMYIGTVHSLCQRIIGDRRFYRNRQRGKPPSLLDELGQYFYLYRRSAWEELTAIANFDTDDLNRSINALFADNNNISQSRYLAVTNTIALFNRLSEENIDPTEALTQISDPTLKALLVMYSHYKDDLQPEKGPQRTDFSLLQQCALQVLVDDAPESGSVFRHVIVDEYQDTNPIQEQLFFTLAAGHKNICVVGDDDQALYRFRGATVENFVQFPKRCKNSLEVSPRKIPLVTNYRSRQQIVQFYTDFMKRVVWQDVNNPQQSYRVAKDITPHSGDSGVSVVASTAGKPVDVCEEVAIFVRRLLDEGKVENENQIAFLFPSLKSKQVTRMKNALEAQGLRVYAPRAGRFLETEESTAIFGLFLNIFGKPERTGEFSGYDYNEFHNWLDNAHHVANGLIQADTNLSRYVADRRNEITTVVNDYQLLLALANRKGWNIKAPYEIATMKRALSGVSNLSDKTRRALSSSYLDRTVQDRAADGRPFTLQMILRRVTSLDWSVLDLFYRLCGFSHFTEMFDQAEQGIDEGPICNMGLVSQYLARFTDEYLTVIYADLLIGNTFVHLFFSSFLYALFRRGESEYEDANDPFPKGRIPFITIHQSKGLEFPVVVLGNPRKDKKGPQKVEVLVNPLIDRESEPLHQMETFDTMRLFYVALSRAKNLLVIPHYKGQGNRINEPFKQMLTSSFPRIPDFDMSTLPAAKLETTDLPHVYSYTADYLLYRRCPRQYMIFRKYGFVPSRSQTMMFGNLVHRTLDDLHQHLIALRSQQ